MIYQTTKRMNSNEMLICPSGHTCETEVSSVPPIRFNYILKTIQAVSGGYYYCIGRTPNNPL